MGNVCSFNSDTQLNFICCRRNQLFYCYLAEQEPEGNQVFLGLPSCLVAPKLWCSETRHLQKQIRLISHKFQIICWFMQGSSQLNLSQ